MYETILTALPQTQCTQCGFDGCAPYAAALAAQTTRINRCPPGGDAGIALLSRITGMPIEPLAADCSPSKPRHIAVIDPQRCIGCTLCIVACPVDAIVGAPKAMHQVISAACTGCDLCLPPCPVDCITMVRVEGLLDWTVHDAAQARTAHEARRARLEQQHSDSQAIAAASPIQPTPASVDTASKQAAIASALARARARKAAAQA